MNMAKQEESISRQVIKNSFWNILATLVNRAGALIFIVLITRWLIPELFGVYTLTLSIALVFATLADLGINSTLIRYVSKAIAKNKKGEAAAYFAFLFKIKLFFSGIITVLLLILAYPLAYNIFQKPALFLPLIIAAFYIFELVMA